MVISMLTVIGYFVFCFIDDSDDRIDRLNQKRIQLEKNRKSIETNHRKEVELKVKEKALDAEESQVKEMAEKELKRAEKGFNLKDQETKEWYESVKDKIQAGKLDEIGQAGNQESTWVD